MHSVKALTHLNTIFWSKHNLIRSVRNVWGTDIGQVLSIEGRELGKKYLWDLKNLAQLSLLQWYYGTIHYLIYFLQIHLHCYNSFKFQHRPIFNICWLNIVTNSL